MPPPLSRRPQLQPDYAAAPAQKFRIVYEIVCVAAIMTGLSSTGAVGVALWVATLLVLVLKVTPVEAAYLSVWIAVIGIPGRALVGEQGSARQRHCSGLREDRNRQHRIRRLPSLLARRSSHAALCDPGRDRAHRALARQRCRLSPRWLIRNGLLEEARRSLAWALRIDPNEIDLPAALPKLPHTRWHELRVPSSTPSSATVRVMRRSRRRM